MTRQTHEAPHGWRDIEGGARSADGWDAEARRYRIIGTDGRRRFCGSFRSALAWAAQVAEAEFIRVSSPGARVTGFRVRSLPKGRDGSRFYSVRVTNLAAGGTSALIAEAPRC